jgi:uncharacterized protein YfaS (alpha-2-macroglobulin family)
VPGPLARLALALALVCACRGARSDRPDAPLPTDINTLPVFDPARLGDAAPPPALASPLSIVEVGPQGQQEAVTAIFVRFDRAVVPLDLARPDPALQQLLRVDPPLPGRARWLAPDHLVFEPTKPPAAATLYTITLAPTVRGLGGHALVAGRSWTFETPRPQVDYYSQDVDVVVDHPPGDPIFLAFAQPTTAAELIAHLSARARPRVGGDPRPVPLTVHLTTRHELERHHIGHLVHHLGRTYTIAAEGRWPSASEIVVELRPGLRGTAGPLPLTVPWARRFSTPEPLTLESTTCTAQAPCGLDPVVLRFRNPLAADQLGKFTVVPPPPGLRVDHWDAREVVISGVFLPGRSYTVRVAPGLKDIHGSELPALTRRVHFVQRPDLSLADDGGVLPPERPIIGVEARALRSVSVTVGIYSDAEVAALPHLGGLDQAQLARLPLPSATIAREVPLTPQGATAWASQALNLAELLGAARVHGLVLVTVAPGARVPGASARNPPAAVRGLYRVTDLGLVADASLPATVVQVVNLSSGTPAAGVNVCRLGPKPDDPLCRPVGVTDADGLIRATELPLPVRVRPPWYDPADEDHVDPDEPPPAFERLRLVAADPRTDDRAHLDLGDAPLPPHRRHSDQATGLRRGERLLARLVRERGAYRPGEPVHVVGWASIETPYTASNLAPLKPGTAVTFKLEDPRGKIVARARGRTSEHGKFSATLTLPEDAALGEFDVVATVLGQPVKTTLLVQDYRIPEFTVAARPLVTDLLVGQSLPVDLRADYYFGGPVKLTRVTRTVLCDALRYRPPGLDLEWAVGLADWRDQPYHTTTPPTEVPARDHERTGERRINVTPKIDAPLLAHRCTISALAEDASLQGVGADAAVTVHPAPVYLAVRPPRSTVVGDRLQIPVRALTRDGDRAAAAAVRVDLERRWREPVYRDDEHGRTIVDHHIERRAALPPCNLALAESGPDATCTLTPRHPGDYDLVVHTRVGDHEARTTASFTAHLPTPPPPPPGERPPRLDLIVPDHAELRPGDHLRVTLRGPWEHARGALVLARAGLRERVPFTLNNGEAVLELSADDTWTPELHLEASVLVPATPPSPARPRGTLSTLHHARGAVVRQSAEHRRLRVAVAAPREAGPGDRIDLRVSVRDAAERPTAARVAVWAVDEAVLALTNEQLPELLDFFIPARAAELAHRDDLRAQLFPYVALDFDPWLRGASFSGRSTRAPQLRQGMATVTGSLDSGPRQRFMTTPLFLADLQVDRSGEAHVTATLPDNLTTFRITAIASAGLAAGGDTPARFGGGEARTVVTAPLVLRAAAPRQLRPGDIAEVAAIVEHRGLLGGQVVVDADLVDATGPGGPVLEFLSKRTARADLPTNGQARVTFRVRARRPAPTAQLDLRARLIPAVRRRGHEASDALRVPLPVEAEATLTERVAIHGELTDARAVQIPVQLPQGALPGHGGLQIRATATILGGLEDAATALLEYPHGCAEQTASRLLPAIALPGLGLAIPASHVEAAIARLAAMQTHSGGFAYWPDHRNWPGQSNVHPYASAYATWVLQRAAAAGLPVPKAMLSAALDDLAERAAATDLAALSAALATDAGVPLALALHALADAGRDVHAPAAALFAHRSALPLFARALLLMALHRDDPRQTAVATLADELLGGLDEGPSEARTVEASGRSHDAYFHSEARSDAIVLLALLQVRPGHPVLAKLARGLLARRRGGAWRNTQENAYALLALADYARLHESTAPDLQARAWLAGRSVLDVALVGRAAAPAAAYAPMTELLHMTEETGGLLPVVLQRQGQGRLYYRLGVTWAPAGDDLPARDQGLALTRVLRGRRGPLRGELPAGEPIALDLELRAQRRVPYLVVDVPIPAGLEPVQLDLGQGRRAAAPLTGVDGHWFNHEELRRDRVVLFADELPPGTHRHTIHLRSTTRGRYAFPPARAEAMYIPELYGRSTGALVDVK